jgi:ribosomal protein L11 methyltransferase
MNWIEISVQADGEAAEAVSGLFNRLNSHPDGQGGAVTEVGGFDPVGEDHHPTIVVKTYLPADAADTPEVQRQIEEGLWYLGRIYPLGEVRIHPLAEEDWANAWKSSYHPLRIGRHFLVIPAWQTAEVLPEPGDIPVILDPGMAFGTGLHPSTQLCLMAMEDVLQPGQRVLDAGCGSGILSIAAVRLGAGRVDAFDIDPIAVRATGENAGLNDLPLAIHVVTSAGPGEGDLWAASAGLKAAWDVILVNILPHVIIGLLEAGLHTYLAPGGRMILAGIIEEREPEVRAALVEHGLAVIQRLGLGDWVSLVAEAS